MTSLNSFFRYLIVVLLLIPMYSCALIFGLISRPAGWFFIRNWNRFFLWLFGVKVTVEFEDPDVDLDSGGMVVGLNQECLLDPIIGAAVSPKIYMSIWNIEYALIPFVGWIGWIYGWVVIRQWHHQAKKKLNQAETYLRQKGFVYSSMEGRRSKDGSLSPYKKGPVVLAIKAGVNIYPVIISGSKDCLPYGEWRIRPGTVFIKFCKEISTKDLTYDDRNSVVAKLRSIAEKELEH